MTKKNPQRILSHLAIVYGIFIGCAVIGMIICPRAFDKFFSIVRLSPSINAVKDGYYWDVEHYAAMVISDTCSAFYPLWPWLTRNIFHPNTVVTAAYQLKTLGAGIFLVILPPLYILFDRLFKSSKLALLILLLFTLNPTGIQRVLGYTESFYCAVTLFLIWSLHELQIKPMSRHYLIAAVSTVIMSLIRPCSIQLIGSVMGASLVLVSLKWHNNKQTSFRSIFQQFLPELKISALISIATIVGYSIYGWICWQMRGDFLAPFHDQANWGRKFGFYPDLLFIRTSMFDMMGLYMPWIILVSAVAFVVMKDKFNAILNSIPKSPLGNVWLLYPAIFIPFTIIRLKLRSKQIETEWSTLSEDKLDRQNEVDTLATNYLFWFSTCFAVITCTIVFLCPMDFGFTTIASLGRHVFAIPFFYISLGYLCIYFNNAKVSRSLYYWLVISIIATIEQWIKYGKDQWLS
ncbi:hypothetical protein [Chamaesiphon minutus]|uniref:Glycosyltransferase RgtA/B/C/D-like domain-containing protein n=1 Tax=Chamaesiphon minutus (strain ATCC 27169 / PCC 6605) TaxID=1173020 RepID=K9UGZ2_CHAP6|nr:hypothetical protein [Chamaesiphon minutus]AFY94372.1 hypothetical protein Cha6605_3370 [Chamaesiphon minutus PCC 6605]